MNTKSKNAIISVSQIIAPILGSRDIVDDLKESIIKAPAPRVDLDFQKVQFISRSAAHEFLKLKEELFYNKKNKKEISFINTNNDVAQMLRIVASNRAMPKPKKEIPELKIESVNINSLA